MLTKANKTIDIDKRKISLNEVEEKLKPLGIEFGGRWSPSECKSKFSVAIIVPYRNREENLHIFLKHLHPFLIKQRVKYGIFLVEPIHSLIFNRGILMNIGFLESMKLDKRLNEWDCFIFHDTDLLPQNELNIYSCDKTPKHMSSAVNVFNYK